MEKLALHGGTPAKTTPYTKGKRFGKEELTYLEEALNQNTLFYWGGSMTKRMCRKFGEMYGAEYCVATSSGTAAIHVALGACDVGPGDEVITAPITDMGSVIGILFQNAIPVFADVDPRTYNMTAESIEAKITDRTKAILVVHLAGSPAEMDRIMEVANKHGVYVIEDCAQAYLCSYKGQLAGTFGHFGCFSLNDFKHISAGDGGMVITNDKRLYEKAHLFTDKSYDRLGTGNNTASLAPNYRMSELVGAVGLAQLEKLEDICARRHAYGERLNDAIKELPGLLHHMIPEGGYSSWWTLFLRVDEEALGCSNKEFNEALRAEGINCSAGYIPSCVYQYELFRNRTAYPRSHYPFDGTHGNPIEYRDGDCPNAEKFLDTCIRLAVNEFFTERDCDETIGALRKVSSYFVSRKNAQ
jgi:dTDP-4-amino-4,6-dideoxygalactose transaminase